MPDVPLAYAIGFDAFIPQGGAASVTATLHYTYTDDGLPLEGYGVFYLDPNGGSWEITTFEAGALYVGSNSCAGSRYCPNDPTIGFTGSTGYPPILLGLNTVADRVTGSVRLFSFVDLFNPDHVGSITTPVYVGWNAVRQQIESDPLFADEPTQVLPVDDLAALEQENRGVLVERLGDGTGGPHASLILEARLNPVAFTARLMLDAARSLSLHARGAWRYTPCGLVPLDGPNSSDDALGLRRARANASLRA